MNRSKGEPMNEKYERIRRLMAEMTLDEKVGQMVQFGRYKNKEKQLLKDGKIGSFLNVLDAKTANEIQRITMEESRLKIPVLIGHDVIHGHITMFPIPLAEACSWNLELIEKTARLSVVEARAYGVRWNFSPMVDIARDPRWGRIAEGSGEDSFLGSQIARARVRGYQSLDENGYPIVAACAKHYIGYGGAEGGRDYNTSDMSEHSLRTTYLPPFAAAADEGALTFMSSFNDILAQPGTGNPYTLRTILKGELGFKGFVVSDWGSIEEMIPHGLADNERDIAEVALRAGVDMDMHSGVYLDHLPSLAKEKPELIPLIDDAVLRILCVKEELGLFDHPFTDEELAEKVTLNPEMRQAALEMAHESLVLLKNDQVLPLKNPGKIALIGPFADDHHTPIGSWGRQASAKWVSSIKDALLQEGLRFTHHKGCDAIDPEKKQLDEAVALAKESDLIFVALGEPFFLSGENNNRAFLNLPGAQLELLEALATTGKPIVTLLFTGRSLAIPETVELSDALLCVWHPGMRCGEAIVDILLGRVNPSGKLVTTFPKTIGQIPLYYNHKNTGRPLMKKYNDMDDQPLFPFGFGLSYSAFTYSNLRLMSSSIKPEESLKLSVDIENPSDMDGKEIVQVYYRDLVARVTRPAKELCAFEKVHVKARSTVTIEFEIPAKRFGYLDSKMNFNIEPGKFTLWVGPDSTQGIATEFSIQ